MDDLSRAIGSLEEQVKENRRLHTEHTEILKDLSNNIVNLSGKFEKHIITEEDYHGKVEQIGNLVAGHDVLLARVNHIGVDVIEENHDFVRELIEKNKKKKEFWSNMLKKLQEKGVWAVLLFLGGIFVTGFTETFQAFLRKLIGAP